MKLFVIIDKQYDPSYRAVQAGHAVAQFLLFGSYGEDLWMNNTLVYLVSDSLEDDFSILTSRGHKCVPFHEPDVGNKMTAFACYSDSNVFSRFQMN